METWPLVVMGLCLCVGCGGEARQRPSDTHPGDVPDASESDTEAGTCASVPLPEQHRAAAQACPTERGSSGAIDTTACVDRSGITCASDADCTAGKTGRCVSGDGPCLTTCSYDACLMDADCAEGPCSCRSSASDVAVNACLPRQQLSYGRGLRELRVLLSEHSAKLGRLRFLGSLHLWGRCREPPLCLSYVERRMRDHQRLPRRQQRLLRLRRGIPALEVR